MIALVVSAVLAALLLAQGGTLGADRNAILRVVEQHNGPSAHVNRIVVHGDYALAVGRSSSGTFTDGLRAAPSGWQLVCSMRNAPPLPPYLQLHCRFPAAVAIELSADEATQTAVERGQFGMATIAQVRAYNWSRKGPDRDQERARLQLLHTLNEQMRMGMITRSQAIQQWNQFRYSWMLP